jgi:hypothetical protein
MFAVSFMQPLAQASDEVSEPAQSSKSRRYQFPLTRLYPNYIANPQRSTLSAQYMSFDKTEIANTTRRRDDLKMGGMLGVVRVHDTDTPDLGWQFTVEAGFHGQFDPGHSADNIGWDGVYAFMLEMRPSEMLAHQFAVHHVSSHVGDEYAERTGRLRINYTRQEVRYGAAWTFMPHWLAYGELGYGYDLRNEDLQEPWRAEVGGQYENSRMWWNDLGLYVALDLSSYEENDWGINTAIQFGFVISRNERRWRMGLELYDGRSQIGEFFQDDERYIGFGVWMDI